MKTGTTAGTPKQSKFASAFLRALDAKAGPEIIEHLAQLRCGKPVLTRHGSFLSQEQIKHPAALGMTVFLAEVVSQIRLACFEQCVVQSQAAILAVVQSIGKLNVG